MRCRSQAVQRDLPRPQEVNSAILRPSHSDTPLTDLQKVNNYFIFLSIKKIHILFCVLHCLKCDFYDSSILKCSYNMML
jgi:hypothetical protein